jgi:hypothetical protein
MRILASFAGFLLAVTMVVPLKAATLAGPAQYNPPSISTAGAALAR